MYKIIITVLGVLFASVSIAADSQLKSSQQKQSYALGNNIASNLKQQGIEIDMKIFFQAIEDVFSSADSKMNEEEIRQALQDLSRGVREKKDQADKGKSEKNTQEGLAYMQENRKDKEVKQTDSGLQYKVIRLGKGEKPKVTDKVKVHYQGTFIGGEEFDSSYKRGTPSSFGLKQVIPGWTEVLQLMPVGSKFQVVIPGNLAYGISAPPSIGPNRTLLFDIELIEIE